MKALTVLALLGAISISGCASFKAETVVEASSITLASAMSQTSAALLQLKRDIHTSDQGPIGVYVKEVEVFFELARGTDTTDTATIAVVKPEFSLGTTAKDTASRGSHVKITLASMADNKALETALSNCLKGEKNQKECLDGLPVTIYGKPKNPILGGQK